MLGVLVVKKKGVGRKAGYAMPKRKKGETPKEKK